MTRRASFNESLKKEAERRLRAALAKLNDRATDLQIQRLRAYGNPDRDGDRDATVDVLITEQLEVERHMRNLRGEIARVVAWGHLELDADAEEAMRAAEEPRKPRATPPRPTAPTASAAPPAAKKTPAAAASPPPAARKAPSAPARPPTAPRTYSVDLTAAVAVAGAPARAARPERPLPSAVRTRPALEPVQEPLFGRPLMLPASTPREEEG